MDIWNTLVSIEIPESIQQIEYNSVLSGLRNIAFPPGCDVDPSNLCCFESLITGLFPNHIDDTDDDEDDNYRRMLDLLRIRFEELSIHRECYYQTFLDDETLMRNLRRQINPWTTQDSTIIGRLNVTGKTQDCLGMAPLASAHPVMLHETYIENVYNSASQTDVAALFCVALLNITGAPFRNTLNPVILFLVV